MSLFGSLFTGVSGLGAQSQATAMISNNIANVNTTGFKRSEASFFSLVTTESRLSTYSPGTVSVNRVQRVDQQGPITQTSSATDAAISGNGMFAVKRDTGIQQEFLYTRSGSFSEDSQGLLRNTAGFVLYAWPIDANGGLPANQGDLTSLVPADVAFLGGLTRPTSTAEISLNLDADQEDYNSHVFTTSSALPITNQQAHFSRGLTVFDALGSSQTLTFEYRKITGPMAHATTQAAGLDLDTSLTDPALLAGIAAGDQFSITVGADTRTYDMGVAAGGDVTVTTVGELISDINNQFGGPGGGVLEAHLNGNGRIVFQTVDPTASLQFADVTGTPISGLSTLNLFTDPVTPGTPYTYDPEAELSGPYTTYPGQTDFPTFSNVTNPNTQGWWEVTVMHPDGSTLTQGLMNFAGDGTLNAAADANGNVDIELSNINWGNGADLQDINIDVERFSQFAGNYDVIFSDQNGAELGLRTGVEITRDGIIVARFSNGATADLYKVPLVTFANMNGLQEVSGTAYSETDESGEDNLREAGSGGAGFLEPSTVEASNVDLADEFAKLIVAQRAFSANTRVINTVDQMTEDLLRLR
ncbi:MAG: flagellar hook-basal body complex protein [Rhodospirillales bacterium]|nr:flagellar hook-basal body complex protein [Rhodospirillales bacterium]